MKAIGCVFLVLLCNVAMSAETEQEIRDSVQAFISSCPAWEEKAKPFEKMKRVDREAWQAKAKAGNVRDADGIHLGNFRTGTIGATPNKVVVMQVLGPDEFLGTMFVDSPDRRKAEKKTLLFRGWATKEYVTDGVVQLSGIVRISAPETYDTALGSNTVYVIAPIELKNYVDQDLSIRFHDERGISLWVGDDPFEKLGKK